MGSQLAGMNQKMAGPVLFFSQFSCYLIRTELSKFKGEVMKTILLCLLSFILCISYTGCSSSDNPHPEPTPDPTMKSFFIPIAPPLSPSDEGGIITSESKSSAAGKSVASTNDPTPEPVSLNKWFYLVNGVGVDDISPTNMPNVLTVSGGPPNGAPNPNGGTAVSIESFNPDNSGKALWKAVSSPDNGYFYLQSATSFKINTSYTYPYPNLLVGYGATFAPLVLGYLPEWNSSTCIYWNQKGSPTGDQSDFQKWLYDTGTGQMWNLGDDNRALYNDAGSALVGNGSSAPANQWYIYPNYYLGQIVAQPNSDPPFPAWNSGEQAAYDYLSEQLLASSSPTCTFEGTSYNGIRCEYINLDAQTSALSDCENVQSKYSNPGTYNNVSISSTDWSNVTEQLVNECTYASGVQNTFNQIGTLLTNVFVDDSMLIEGLVGDLYLSETQNVSGVPLDIIEGMLYTVLSAVPDAPVCGILANVMETGVNVSVAESGDSKNPITTEYDINVADLNNQLSNAMTAVFDGIASAETKILQDWGRLQKVYPLTLITGFNGLGMTPYDKTELQQIAKMGYTLSVMQELLPVSSYGLSLNAAVQNDTFSSIPSYAKHSYSTFGSDTSNVNTGYLYMLNEWTGDQEYPDSQVMQTDILNNGANPFELFNGINGWAGMPLSVSLALYPQYSNLSCTGSVLTLFNATSADMNVLVTPSQGKIAAPGYLFNANTEQPGGLSGSPEGSESSGTFELRPYGYLPIWVTAYGGSDHDNNLTVDVKISDAQNDEWYCSFTFGGDGCYGKVPTYQWDVSYQSGWSGIFYSLPQTSYPAGLWMTLYETD